MEPKIHRLVWRELQQAHVWYLKKGGDLAERFLAAMWRAYEEVVLYPHRWPYRDRRHRYRLLRRYPFQLIYRQEFELLHIVALAHNKRRSGYWARRK